MPRVTHLRTATEPYQLHGRSLANRDARYAPVGYAALTPTETKKLLQLGIKRA